MKKITHYSGVFVLFAFALASIPFGAFSREDDRIEVEDRQIRAERGSGGEYVSDELIVKYKGDGEEFRVEKLSAGRSPRDAAREFEMRGDVEYAEPNYLAYASMVPNDPYYYPYQWHLKQIGMEQAWNVSIGSGATVAVIDTGVAYETYRNPKNGKRYYKAPDLAATCFKPGYDYVENDTHANDDQSHGTHVAGTIAQSTNNVLGVAGVAFGSCLMPVKVLDRFGTGTHANIAKGIRFAADNGANVINLSLGGSTSSQTLLDAIAYASNKGVTIVAAAGNDNRNGVSYPAAYDSYVIAVGATRYDETRAPYSNFGTSLDVVAPGGDTSVDQNGDGYGDGILQNTFNPNTKKTNDFSYWFFQGTSMAAPHVAGLAALVISNGNATSTADVRSAIESTAKDLGTAGKDTTYGWGLINAPAALSWAKP